MRKILTISFVDGRPEHVIVAMKLSTGWYQVGFVAGFGATYLRAFDRITSTGIPLRGSRLPSDVFAEPQLGIGRYPTYIDADGKVIRGGKILAIHEHLIGHMHEYHEAAAT